MIKKWKKIKEVPYKTDYRKMSKVIFELPDGKKGDFDIIKNRDIVRIFALTPDNKVIIAKQYRPGPDKIFFDLPAGVVEENERLSAAAKRELLEETGYAGKLTLVGKSYNSAYSIGCSYSFVAVNCLKVAEPNLDPKEFIETVLISIKQFKQNLRKGNLTDVACGYQALDYLGLL